MSTMIKFQIQDIITILREMKMNVEQRTNDRKCDELVRSQLKEVYQRDLKEVLEDK